MKEGHWNVEEEIYFTGSYAAMCYSAWSLRKGRGKLVYRTRMGRCL